MDKFELQSYLEEGMSTREIARVVGKHHNTISYWIDKLDLKDSMRYKKPEYNNPNYFSKIDTKEKAYILGFLLGDSYLSDDIMELTISLSDIEIMKFIQSEIGCNIQIRDELNKKKRIFPSAIIVIGNNQITKDLNKLFGGQGKVDRNIPFISQKLERYLLQGFFDAEGCVTWGYRKDRGRVWHKISFTSQYKMLEVIQNILLKHNISTKLKPKSDNSKCFVIEFSSKNTVLDFLNIIYPNDDFIVLNRKYENAQALRLELGEFGES